MIRVHLSNANGFLDGIFAALYVALGDENRNISGWSDSAPRFSDFVYGKYA